MVYPRGFVGAELSVVQKVNRGIQINLSNISSVIGAMGGDRETYPHNEEVNAIADTVLRDLAVVETFDFRKRILLTAMSAFGTKSFYYWYRAQYKSPIFSDNHSRFLDDTLSFITNGHRELDCSIWLRVLSFDDSHPTYEIAAAQRDDGMSEKARAFFGGAAEDQNLSLNDVIQKWVSHNGGFEDLAITMNILFGN
jgi:hypothetical protein